MPRSRESLVDEYNRELEAYNNLKNYSDRIEQQWAVLDQIDERLVPYHRDILLELALAPTQFYGTAAIPNIATTQKSPCLAVGRCRALDATDSKLYLRVALPHCVRLLT